MTRNIRVAPRDIAVTMAAGGAFWLYMVAVRGLLNAIPAFDRASRVWQAQVSLGSGVFPSLLLAIVVAAAMLVVLRTRRISTPGYAASTGALLACIVVPSIAGAGSHAGIFGYGLIRAIAVGLGLVMLASGLSLTVGPRPTSDASR